MKRPKTLGWGWLCESCGEQGSGVDKFGAFGDGRYHADRYHDEAIALVVFRRRWWRRSIKARSAVVVAPGRPAPVWLAA